MQNPIPHPLLVRASSILGTRTEPRIPTALDFVLFLAEREARLERLDKRLAEVELEVRERLARRNFQSFWTGEYARAFDTDFQMEIEADLKTPKVDWLKLHRRVDERIRALAGSSDSTAKLVGDWLFATFTITCYRHPPNGHTAEMRLENYKALDMHELGEDHPEAHHANAVANDPMGYGMRLWIRRQRLETQALLMSMCLINSNGELTCARPTSGTVEFIRYETLVDAYAEGTPPTCQPIPEAEAAWEQRLGPFRETIGQPG